MTQTTREQVWCEANKAIATNGTTQTCAERVKEMQMDRHDHRGL